MHIYVNELTGHITFFMVITSFLMTLYRYLPMATICSIPTIKPFFFLGSILLLYYPLTKIIEKSRNFTDKSYWMNLSLSKEIEKIVENMFLIKILNKDKIEIDNFEKLFQTLTQ